MYIYVCVCVCVCIYICVNIYIKFSHEKGGNPVICYNMDGP